MDVKWMYLSGCTKKITLETALERQLKNADCVKGSPFLHIELKLSDIYIIIYIFIYKYACVYIYIEREIDRYR